MEITVKIHSYSRNSKTFTSQTNFIRIRWILNHRWWASIVVLPKILTNHQILAWALIIKTKTLTNYSLGKVITATSLNLWVDMKIMEWWITTCISKTSEACSSIKIIPILIKVNTKINKSIRKLTLQFNKWEEKDFHQTIILTKKKSKTMILIHRTTITSAMIKVTRAKEPQTQTRRNS